MGKLLRGAQTNDFGAAVLRARSAGKQAWENEDTSLGIVRFMIAEEWEWPA